MVLLFLLLKIIIIKTNSIIKENPISLVNEENYFVLNSTDDYYYVITYETSLKIEKESGNIISIYYEYNFDKLNYIYIEDKSGNNFLYFEKHYYYINYAQFIEFQSIQINPSLNNLVSENIHFVNSIPQINDFIIYGYYKKQLVFCSKFQ